MIFSCWMLWIFLEAQQVLIPSGMHTKFQRQKASSPTKGLITPTKRRIQNSSRMMLSTVNSAGATLAKPNTLTSLTCWKVNWPQNKPLSNWNCWSQPLQELRINITCNRYGSKNKRALTGTFCGGITMKMLCQLWRQFKKWFAFYHDKIIDMLKLGCTLPNLANICLHKSTDANFIPSQREIKTYWKKNLEDVVGGPSIVFTRKAVVARTFICTSTNICKSIVGIDDRHFYPTRFVNELAHWPVYVLGYRFRNH